jgi:phosphodiesterase/alkaline phosphatase D-like protein
MRRVLLAAALVSVAATFPSVAGAAGFTYGVSSSEIKPSSALLWTRAGKTGKVGLKLARDRRFRRGRISRTVLARRSNDLTVQTTVRRLRPGTRYYYFWHQGRKRSVIGTFRTAPRPSSRTPIRFAVTGDADGVKNSSGQNQWNKDGAANFATYKAMTRERNHFNVNLGDTIYSDSASPPALSVAAKRKKYRQNLGYGNLVRLRQAGPVLNQWDDHEFVDDFTRKSEGCDVGSVFSPQYACDSAAIYRAGVKAFREYMPVTYTARNGTYRTFRWGSNLEIFVLDERSFRSIRASEIKDNPSAPEPTTHVCENPKGSGQDDPAPQIPQRIRSLFALLYPPANNPARPECLGALNSPDRTMLGKRQYDRFTTAIAASKARWKIIINEVPMMEFGLNPYDDWQGYEFERERLLTYLKNKVKNVAIVSTDFHTNWVNDARIKTFPEDGGPINSGIREFIAGGVADQLFGYEIDAFSGTPDSWKAIDGAFMMRPPPDGPGMECSNMITFGYVQVEASPNRLKVEMKDNTGRQIKNALDGKPCGPYIQTAR